VDRSPLGSLSGPSPDPRNPAGLIWSQGWSRTRRGRWAARAYLLALAVAVLAMIAKGVWDHFRKPYYVVAYRAVIERLADGGGDQLVQEELEFVYGFSQLADARQFEQALDPMAGQATQPPVRSGSAIAPSGARRGSTSTTPSGQQTILSRPYPILISTEARMSPLCGQPKVFCEFLDGRALGVQGENWRPSRLDLAAASDQLADGNGGHR